MNVIAWLLVGGIAGWLASVVMGTNRSQGITMDILMGIAGGLVGGFLVSLLGFEGVEGFNIWSIAVAVLGAVFLTWMGRMLRNSNA